MIGHYEQGFITQAQPLGFHRRCNHFKGFARTYFVGKQGIATVDHMGDGVELMLPKGDLRIHAAEDKVATVIFPWSCAVHFLIVLLDKGFSATGVLPNPIPERFPDGLLLLRRQGRFLCVQNTFLSAVCVFDGVIDTNVP